MATVLWCRFRTGFNYNHLINWISDHQPTLCVQFCFLFAYCASVQDENGGQHEGPHDHEVFEDENFALSIVRHPRANLAPQVVFLFRFFTNFQYH